jgi:Glycosyltransferase Family 4
MSIGADTEHTVKQRKRVLFIAYFFPPLGGAGVQRSLKFSRYLTEFGWDPTVLTVRGRDYWMADATLANELGGGVEIVRTASMTGLGLLKRFLPKQAGAPGKPRGSGRSVRLLRRLASWVCVPDTYIGWIPFALHAARSELARRRYDLIYTTSSPDSAHLIGRTLARESGLPWVADFRDPWTRRMAFDPPTALHRLWHQRLERSVCREASAITVTAEATGRDFISLIPDLPTDKISVITNGYDENDFTDVSLSAGEKMTVIHAGQLNPERPARPFLAGLATFFAAEPDARAHVQVRFIGAHYGSDQAAVEELGLGDQVVFEPGMTHKKLINEIMNAEALLLMEKDCERGGLIIPGKLFEYLRTDRPILGLLPRGDAWNLVGELGAGECCATGDESAVAEQLGSLYRRWRDHSGRLPANNIGADRLRRFERRELTGRLAELFNRITHNH